MRSNFIDRSNFSRACGAHLNTRLLFCIVHGILDRFCDDQRPEPQRYFHSLFPLGSGLRGHLVRGRGGIVCRSERRRSEFKNGQIGQIGQNSASIFGCSNVVKFSLRIKNQLPDYDPMGGSHPHIVGLVGSHLPEIQQHAQCAASCPPAARARGSLMDLMS